MRYGEPGAVVIGGYVNALDAVRALAPHTGPVSVVTSQPYDIAHHSRFASGHVPLTRFRSQPNPLLALLRHQAREWDGRVLIPTHDPALETLARHREELSRHFRVTVPSWEITSRLLLKDRTLAAAGRVNVPVPSCYGAAAPGLLDRQSPPLPLVVKPSLGHPFQERLGRKLIAVHNQADYTAALALLTEHGLEARVYDLVPGPDFHYFNYLAYIDRQGRLLAGMAVRKIRKAPAFFGVGRVVTNKVAVAIAAALRRHTLAVLAETGWHGPASAEFKLDPRDGSLRLMEINGRCSLMMGIARRAGINIPLLIWREATGRGVAPLLPNEWLGVWTHLHADVLHALLSQRRERVRWRDYLTPYQQPLTFGVWNLHDPKPFVAQWAHSFASAVRFPYRAARGQRG